MKISIGVIYCLLIIISISNVQGQTNSSAKQSTGRLSDAVWETIKKNHTVVEYGDLGQQRPRLLRNASIIGELKSRGIYSPQRTKDRTAFFKIAYDKNILEMNGKSFINKSSMGGMRQMHHNFGLADEYCVLPDFANADRFAHQWWHRNQKINYMPLRVSLINYYGIEEDPSKDRLNQVYFAASPFFSGTSSQIVTFGFEDAFFTTNTNKTIRNISITVAGNKYILNRNGLVPVLFANEGTYAVKVEAEMSDGALYVSGFDFSIKSLHGVWTNSRIDEQNNLDFVY